MSSASSDRDPRIEAVRTGSPATYLLACVECGVLIWDADAHYAHAHPEASAPSPDREKLIAEALERDRHDWCVDHEFEPEITKNAFERGWEAALAAQSVLDPEKVAGFLEGAGDEWQFKFDQFLSETGSDPGPLYDYLARVLCEAAKRGELNG